MQTVTLEVIKARLKAQGYGGLYFSGECGCTLDDLAPCGECQREDGEEYINGCSPGYLFKDPRPGAPTGWMIRGSSREPTLSDWERMDGEL